MTLSVVGLTRADILQGLHYFDFHQPTEYDIVILSVVYPSEPNDFAALRSRFGDYFVFLLLNNDALRACVAAGRKITVLGTIEHSELKDGPSILGTARLMHPTSHAARSATSGGSR